MELRDIDFDVRIGRPSEPQRREFTGNELAAVEVVFRMVNVPFPKAGQYAFKLLANHRELVGGEALLRVLPG